MTQRTKSPPIATDRQILALAPKDKLYFASVAGKPRLFLEIAPNGTKTWIYRYSHPITKKQNKERLGKYPTTSLADAGKLWHDNERLYSQGIDPKAHKKALQAEQARIFNNKFDLIAWQWYEQKAKTYKDTTKAKRQVSIKLLCDQFKDTPIQLITPPQVLDFLISIQETTRGKDGNATDKASRLAGFLSDIFDYAMARGYCKDNPITPIKSQLETAKYNNRPAIIKPQEFGKLLNDIYRLDNTSLSTQNSLKLLALTFARNGDVRAMKWSDIDFESKQWHLKPIKGNGSEKWLKI